MKSKGLLRFQNRLDRFDDDIEFVDIITKNTSLLKDDTVIFKGVSQESHPPLSRKSNSQSRKLVAKHLKKTVYVSYIKEIYEEVQDYLKYILSCGAKSHVDYPRLIGGDKVTLDANTLLNAGSYPKVQDIVMSMIFQSLAAKKGTLDTIKGVIQKLGLKIEPNVIKEASTYLEIRHILVHSDGRPEKKFKENHPEIKLNKSKISLSKDLIVNAKEKIINLIESIDVEMISKGYIPQNEMQP